MGRLFNFLSLRGRPLSLPSGVSCPSSVRLLTLLVCCGAALSSVAWAEPDWVEVRSPNFTVISSASVKEASNVARQFEQIREAIRRVLPGMSLDPGQPILILAVRDQNELRQLIPEYWEDRERARPAGMFLRAPERHFVALRLNVGGDRPFQTIYHEYLHLLVSLNFPDAPLWVNEGLAEFYASTTFGEDDVVFGLPSGPHVSYLRQAALLPLDTLLRIDEKSPYYNHSHKVSIFYSQSWALVHYLLTQEWDSKEPPLDRYLRQLSEGVSSEKAARSLGDLQELEAQLRRYVRQDDFFVFRYPEAISVSPQGFTVRQLSEPEAKAVRASFLISNERPQDAEKLIAEAIAEDPRLPLAFESLGYLSYVSGKLSEARAAFAKAVELGSDSYLSHYFLGFLALEEPGNLDNPKLIEARLRRSIELRPSFPFSYTALATLLIRQGGDQTQKAEALQLARRACQLEPQNGQLLQTLVYALGSTGQMEEAEKTLGQIYHWADSASELELAGRVEKSLADFRTYWEAKREYDQQIEELERERIATGRARNSWRTRQAEGTVSSVSCTAPASMEIVLDTGPSRLRLVSRNFSAVQFFFLGAKPGEDFHPCEGLKGKHVLAAYQPDRQQELNRLVSVKLRE